MEAFENQCWIMPDAKLQEKEERIGQKNAEELTGMNLKTSYILIGSANPNDVKKF